MKNKIIRPWGNYTVLVKNKDFLIKKIVVPTHIVVGKFQFDFIYQLISNFLLSQIVLSILNINGKLLGSKSFKIFGPISKAS